MKPIEEGMLFSQYLAENEENFCIWHVTDEEETMQLYKTSDDTFRTIEQGIWGPILGSPVSTIVREDLLTFLQPYIVEEIECHPVTIYDRPSDSNKSGYYRISSKETYDYQDIKIADHSGKRAWVDVGTLAVTRELKKILEQSDIPDLDFSPFFLIGC